MLAGSYEGIQDAFSANFEGANCNAEAFTYGYPVAAPPKTSFTTAHPAFGDPFFPFIHRGSLAPPNPIASQKTAVPQTAGDILRLHRMNRKCEKLLHGETQRSLEEHKQPPYPVPGCHLPGFYPQPKMVEIAQIPPHPLNYAGYMYPYPPTLQNKKKKKFLPFTIKKKRKIKMKNLNKKKSKRKVKIKFEWKRKRKFKKITKKRLKKQRTAAAGGKKEKKRLKREKRRQKILKMKRRIRDKLSLVDISLRRGVGKFRAWIINSAHFLCISLGLTLIFLALCASHVATYLPLTSGAVLVAAGLFILAMRIVRWIKSTQGNLQAKSEREKWTFLKQSELKDIATLA